MATASGNGDGLGESIGSFRMVQPSDNVDTHAEDFALNGYAWTKKRGYFWLPLDCVEVEADQDGVRIWHHNSGSFKIVQGTGLEEEEQSETQSRGDWSEYHYNHGWDRSDRHRNRDGDVPEWDGKSEHRTTYFRRIDLWALTTGVPPKDRGCRLLQKLSGEAFEKLENIDGSTLKTEDSIERFKKCIVEVYEPIEDYRIGKIMDEFLDNFARKNDQEIVDYNLAWAREVLKVEKVAGELQEKWKAHLYLKKMRLQALQKTQVLTGALGTYTVDALSRAALTTFPNIKEAFSRKDMKDKDRGSFQAGRRPGGRFAPRKKPFKKGWKTNEAHIDDESWQDSDEEYDDLDEYEESSEEEEPEHDETEYNCPDELEAALVDSEAFLTRAKKQRAEIEKARGFFKKGAPKADQKAGTQALKNKLPCAKCGQRGHWHKDDDCPKKNEPFPSGKGPGGTKGSGKKKRGKKKKKKKDNAFQSNVCYVTTLNGLDLPHVAYVDTACARSVTGQENADALVAECKVANWPYALVDDSEPFRFGPGKRIWSRQALIIAVCWGNVTVVLRFSIVPQEVPFLISKFVFKRLGCTIDLDDNELTMKRLNHSVEPIYDLTTGHVGVELVKVGANPPEVQQSTMDLCAAGDEVTVDDMVLRKQLSNLPLAHGTHVVGAYTNPTKCVEFDLTHDDTDNEHEEMFDFSDISDDDHLTSEFLTHVANNQKLNPRSRAAPFFDELAPGWRARARDLAPPYARNALESLHKADMAEGDVSGMGTDCVEDDVGGIFNRKRKTWKTRRQEIRVPVDDEQSRTDGEGPQGVGDDSGDAGEGDSYLTAGKASESEGCHGDAVRSSGKSSQGSGQHAESRTSAGMFAQGHQSPGSMHKAQDDCVDQGRCSNSHDIGNTSSSGQCGLGNDRGINCQAASGSLKESQGDCTKGLGLVCDQPQSGLFKWAKNVVSGLGNRSKTLVSRVLHTSDDSSVSCALDFESTILGKESWTQVTPAAKFIDDAVMDGLDNPVWRQTTLVETGKLIESTPWPPQGLNPDFDGPADIKTTVWYGKTSEPKKSRLKRNLLKGVQTAAAIFLLEAMVLMSASSQWSGSWTQKMYGTGQADVWEVFGADNLTRVSWRQGWRALEPLQAAKFSDTSFQSYIVDTLEERSPRLVVMECPNKHWYNCTRPIPKAKNAAKQAEKKLREKLTPFLETAQQVAEKQCYDGHDFLLETPLTSSVMSHPIVKQMTDDEMNCVVNGKSWQNGKPTWWLTSAHDIAQQLEKNNVVKNPVKMVRNVMTGLAETLHHKEPERIKSLIRSLDSRIRGAGIYADTHMVNLSEMLCRPRKDLVSCGHDAFAVIDEKGDIPEAGIEFDLPPELHQKVPKALLSSIRRLHFNSGHPPNDELERIVRLSGGSELARQAIKGIKCTVCRKAAPTKTPKPAKAKMNIGQFNETVLIDLGYEKDSVGKTHGWAVMVDEGTDWCVVKYLGNGKTAGELYRILEEGWIDWAGPPDVLVADSERGFIAEEFAFKLGKAGTLFTPAAGYAPWQKGRVERKISTICSIIKKTVLHLGLKGPEEMKLAGIEAAAAVNQRPGASGVSPGMMLFGQRLKMYGELYADGEPAYHHLDGNDASTELGRRLQIRCSSRQAAEAHYAKEMVRKTVAARTRLVEKVEVGELVFFYRCYPSAKAQKLQAQRGCYLGPGVVIGHQKQNAWVSYAGRCYLVAPEHLRSMAPDEICSTKPLIRQGLEELRKASKLQDTIDITRQTVSAGELEQAVNSPAGDDHSAPLEEVAIPPMEVEPVPAEPLATLEQPVEEVDMETEALQAEVERHVEAPNTTAGESSAGEKRSASSTGIDEEENPRPPPAPITWQPRGDVDNLRWNKKSRTSNICNATAAGKRVLTAKIKKKMLDKEIPYKEIPVKDRPLYEAAEEREWADWLKNKSVRIVKGKEVADVYKHTDPSRFINLRFVYRDKNASIRTPQTYLPVKAKARMCAQGFSEPLAKAGLVKLDSPTVQRVGIMVFLQLVANFDWIQTWRKGDISSAFLQGTERDSSKGKLYLRPPRDRPLAGVDWNDLLEVLKSVYGLPDAPRAWWEEVTGFLRSLGFVHSRMDVAFMVLYHEDGSVGAMSYMLTM